MQSANVSESGALDKSSTWGKKLRSIITYAIALACLIWIFYNIHPERLWHEIHHIYWGWVVVAVLLDTLSYAAQGARWRLLMRPLGTISTFRSTQAIYAGLFTNEILPLRPGELVRAFLASRWLNSSFTSVFPSIAVERIFDGIWLVMGIGITAILIPLPGDLVVAGDYLGVLVIVACVLFVIFAFRKPSQMSGREHKNRLIGFLLRLVQWLREGIYKIGISRNLFLSFALSSLVLIFQALSFWFVTIAYHIELPVLAGAAVFLIVHLGTAIPNAPSNIGSFQLFTVLGLTLFGIDKTTAAGFSVVVFILLTLPLWFIGFVAVLGTGMKFSALRQDIARKIKERFSEKVV